MIRRLRRALDWRFKAVVDRQDALAGSTANLDARIDDLDTQLAQVSDSLAQVHTMLEQRIQPVLQTIVAEEAGNRRRLHELRAAADYELAYSHPEPLVSITVATTGQRSALLERALPSLLAQTYTNIEVLVVGDAAADSVEATVAALGDPRVRYANLSQRIAAHPNPERHWSVGSTMARNEATRRARGLWLLHFDDDDHLRPNAIASLLTVARERRAEVAYGGFEQHHPDGQSSTSIGFPPRPGAFELGWSPRARWAALLRA